MERGHGEESIDTINIQSGKVLDLQKMIFLELL